MRGELKIDPSACKDPGLYLYFADGDHLDLTRKRIHEITQRFLNDPDLLPDAVKSAAEYQPCSICPEKDHAAICHAIMITLPFVEDMDKYMSYEKVTAIYREPESGILHRTYTTMPQALQYVSMLSLMEYCEIGRTYQAYFEGINPLMPANRIAKQVFRNIFTEKMGDMEAVKSLIRKMRDELTITCMCQLDRLRLISKTDSFINAFVNTQNASEWLIVELEEYLEKTTAQESGKM